MMRVKFEFDKLVSYWNTEQGQGVRVDGSRDFRSWTTDCGLDFEARIDSLDQVQEALRKQLDIYGYPTDYFAIMDDGRVSFNVIEDGSSNVIEDESKYEREQLYICDYSVFIEIQHVYEPTINQLKEMFPTADH